MTVAPWAIAGLVYSIFVRGERLYWVFVGWLRLAIWAARVICGVRARVQGFGNLPGTSVILLPKHQSTWETFAFPTLMPQPLCYVFKRELLFIPFFGWAMARMDLIHIDRSKRAEAWAKVAEQGRRYMAQGQLGDHVPGRDAHAARQPGHVQGRRHAPCGRDRPAGGADRRHVGALLAAQELPPAPRA